MIKKKKRNDERDWNEKGKGKKRKIFKLSINIYNNSQRELRE